LIGFDRVISYYLEVGPQVGPLYRSHERNFSAWSLGFRLLDGTYSPVIAGIEAPPLIYAPALAPYLSILITGSFVLLGLWMALRAHSFDTSIAILAGISLLANPIAWSHYLVLVVLPVAILLPRLADMKLRLWEAIAAVLTGLLLFFGGGLSGLLYLLTGSSIGSGSPPQVSFAASLLTLAPAVGIVGLIWLAWRSDKAVANLLE
jgi:hypothetical protein